MTPTRTLIIDDEMVERAWQTPDIYRAMESKRREEQGEHCST